MPLGVIVREVKVVPPVGESEGAGSSWRVGVEKRLWGVSTKWTYLVGGSARTFPFRVVEGARVGQSERSAAVEAWESGGLDGVSLRKDWRREGDRDLLTLFAQPSGLRKGMILLASAIE